MDDLSRTLETYARVADEYAEVTGDRSAIRDGVRRFCDRLDGRRVLDVGCGPGFETAMLADRGYDVVGVDVVDAFACEARDRSGAPVALADMRRLPVVDDAVDGAWASASFHHVRRAEAPATLAEFHRVLRPDGVFHFSTKRGSGVREGPTYDAYEDDERRFTLWEPGELTDALVESGFAVESVESDDRWIVVFATNR